MRETQHAFFHLDQPACNAALPAGPVRVAGWAVGHQGIALVDIRVRLGNSLFPCVHGFPREDLARHFGLRDKYLHGGFEGMLSLPLGLSSLEFEGCTIDGEWHCLESIVLTGEPSGITAPCEKTKVAPHELARALQFALRQSSSKSPNAAASTVVQWLPNPRVTRYPHLPFHGHVDQPALIERAVFGRLCIEGWLFHENAKIRSVKATVDLQASQALAYDCASPYVSSLFPQISCAAHCSYHGWIDVPAQLPRPVSVRIYAELDDGSWHLCHVQRAYPWEGEEEKQNFVKFSRITFVRVYLALREACSQFNLIPPSFRQSWKVAHGVYREFKTRAPRGKIRTHKPMSLAAAITPHIKGLSVMLITHNLSYEGAPLFLLEYAQYLSAGGAKLRIIAAADGPLAKDYARLGADLQIVDVGTLSRSINSRELRSHLASLAASIDLRNVSLVVSNTLSAYWGVHLAHRAGVPSLFYIHESTTPASFYLGHMQSAALPAIEETFKIASHVSFLTESTRGYYRPILPRDNHSINPGWIDIAALDRYFALHPRQELKARLNLSASTRLVINVGTVCDRKGQHIFARAVDLLWRRHPEVAATCEFIMIGGHETLFDQVMTELLVELDRPNLKIVPATSTPAAYYGAANLFVCSSYEESFPRVILEAMAANVPIVSTAVHGIPEMIRADTDGLLVPPGNSAALCEGMSHLLLRPNVAAACASHARSRVTAEFDSAKLLARHAALCASFAKQ